MSLSHAEIIAGKQPDGTQGIAVVDFQGSDGSLKELVGCAIHLSPSDKSLRNILKIEERHKKVIYFIFLPWFNSCRPTSIDEIKSISVKLHRYNKADSAGKKFNINDIDAMASYFEKYKNDYYFVIPCEDENFTKSSFLENWSSELLLHNNSDQLFQTKKFFTGFKKDGDQHPGKSLFTYCKFDLKKSSGGAHSGYYVEEELEEQGVLMIRNEKEKESYVVGCYLKKPSEIKLFCFLLQGLAEISTEVQPKEPSQSNEDGGRGTPEQPSSGVTVETPPGTVEQTANDSDSSAEQGRQRASLDETANDLCPKQNHLSPEAMASVGSSGPHYPLTEGTDGAGGSSGPHYPLTEGTDGAGGSSGPHYPLTEGTDGAGGSSGPHFSHSALGQHPSTARSDADHIVSQTSAIKTQAYGNLPVPQPQPALTSPLAFQPDGEAFEDFLKEFAEQVGVEWKTVGRRLGIKENVIRIIDDENKAVEEKAVQMFFKWRKLNGKEATPQELVYVLEHKVKNRLLAEKVTEWMKTGKSPS